MTKIITFISSLISDIFCCAFLWMPFNPVSKLLQNSPAPKIITFVIFIVFWSLFFKLFMYLKTMTNIGLGVGVAEGYIIAMFVYELYREFKDVADVMPIFYLVICGICIGSGILYSIHQESCNNTPVARIVTLVMVAVVIYFFITHLLYNDFAFPHTFPLVIAAVFLAAGIIISTAVRPKRIKSVGSTNI